MKTIAVRLHDSQDILQKIQHLAMQYNIWAGVVLSAIVSLHGTVSINGCHLHTTVSDVNGKVYERTSKTELIYKHKYNVTGCDIMTTHD